MQQSNCDSIARLVWTLTLAMMLALLAVVGWPVLAQAEDELVHIVVTGDTLSEIAEAHGTDVETLRTLNGLSGSHIWIGQRLRVRGELAGSTGLLGAAGVVAPAIARRDGQYTVKSGDTLTGIAQRYAITVDELVRFNGDALANGLLAGSRVWVPVAIHIVQPGEQLGQIGTRYGTTAAAVAEANGIENPRLIVPGQRLLIPVLPASSGSSASWPADAPESGKWILVDLSEQQVVAYVGRAAVRSFVVSTGLPQTPTVTGTFRIRLKTRIQDMYGGNRAAGNDYYLEDVQWVQYFFEDYAFHGTYWHTNFGSPASRGCVNMTNADAEWLFHWAGPEYDMEGPLWQSPMAENPGTLVIVRE